jgi:LDH2 family malate/lactate/ureidoglycolate dehydrogenase
MAVEATLVPLSTIREFVTETFHALGVPDEDARICTDVLVNSDIRGIDSHGIGRLHLYVERVHAGVQEARTAFELLKESETTATIDGKHGMGHVIGYRAMEMAIDKARRYGLGAVAVKDSTHYGFAGYYPLMAVSQDMMGLTVTNARPSVAPTFGVEPMLGTNPIAFGAPSDMPYPFLVDAATSISQRGKLEHMERDGKNAPEGWAIDQKGEPYTETEPLLKDLLTRNASLLPLGGSGESHGGHKGYGYAAMVEILSASLAGGKFMKDLLGFDEQGSRVPYSLGHFFLALDVGHFIDPEHSKQITGDIMRGLQNADKAPDEDRIYVPGQKEYEREQERRRQGIPVGPRLRRKLSWIREVLELPHYAFLAEE